MSLASAYLACLRIRRRQGWPWWRAAVSAFAGARALSGMRSAVREFVAGTGVGPSDADPAPKPRRLPCEAGRLMVVTDGSGRRCEMLVKEDGGGGRLVCQDTATGRRSTITLS